MRVTRVALVVTFVLSVQAAGQSRERQIAEALRPLPEALQVDATVIVWGDGAERSVLREGTNKWICAVDEPTPGFDVRCHHVGLDAYYRRNRELTAQGKNGEERRAILAEEMKSGKLEITYAALSFRLTGRNLAAAHPTTVVRIPFATAESTGLPTEPDAHRPWLMRAGTVAAHIMFPGS